MEKIIFFGLVIPIFAFVLYLGVSAIMKGSEAKSALKEEANLKNDENENSFDNKKKIPTIPVKILNKIPLQCTYRPYIFNQNHYINAG